MVERTPDSSVSRRNVLKKASGLLAAGTLLAGRGAAGNARAANLTQSQNTWTGEYKGRLDGREARLKITAESKHYLGFTLEDLDRNETFAGVTPTPTDGDTHVIEDLTLVANDGEKVIERLYVHGFDDDHLSGYTRWRGNNYGLAFASVDSGGFEADAGDGPTRDAGNWYDLWDGVYRGRNDGRDASLYIRVREITDTMVRFFVGLYDRERDNYFKGETWKHRDSKEHIMYPGTLRTDDGQKKTVDRLHLHGFDTHYVSGRTEWSGSYYGLHFGQQY